MDEVWRLVRSVDYPLLEDRSSSSKYVYLRRNVHEVTVVDMMDNSTHIEFEYEELKLTHAQFIKSKYYHDDRYLLEQQISNQELMLVENQLETDSKIESLAQQVSELELVVVENSLQ